VGADRRSAAAAISVTLLVWIAAAALQLVKGMKIMVTFVTVERYALGRGFD
jgi:hypothetical protein